MPGQRCAVAICKSFYHKSKGEHVFFFFCIPKREDIRKQWIIACKRQDKFNPDTSRICSLHFKEEDFELDFRASLLGIEVKRPRTLKPTGKANNLITFKICVKKLKTNISSIMSVVKKVIYNLCSPFTTYEF